MPTRGSQKSMKNKLSSLYNHTIKTPKDASPRVSKEEMFEMLISKQNDFIS